MSAELITFSGNIILMGIELSSFPAFRRPIESRQTQAGLLRPIIESNQRPPTNIQQSREVADANLGTYELVLVASAQLPLVNGSVYL